MKLHPLTILLQGGGRALGGGVAGFTVGSVLGTALAGRGVLPPFVSAAGVPLAILGAAIAIAYEIAHYRHFEYELSADTLDIQSGVFFRRDREIPLRRVQNVDISRDVLARVLGVAVVAIETAGGGETEAQLRYVGLPEARRLQEGIRRRKTEAGPATDEASTDERELLFALDDSDLLLLSVLSFDARIVTLLVFVAPAFVPRITSGIDSAGGMAVVALVLIGAFVSVLGLWALSAAATFVQFYGFKLHRLGDELQYERGLIQRYDGSIPLEKIQTLVVEENVLMRQFGYAALSVDTAGYAPGSTPKGGSEAAIPLASRTNVYELAREIEPFDQPELTRPPKRARRRYVARYSIVFLALTGLAFALSQVFSALPWYGTIVFFPLVVFGADRKWRHRGYGLGDGYAFTRTGFFRRRTHVVPDFRVQTVIDRQSPFQRRWSLASVIVDTASSSGFLGTDAVAIDLDVEHAHQFRETVRDRLQAALGDRRSPTNED